MKNIVTFLICVVFASVVSAQPKTSPLRCNVLAYYTGDAQEIDKYNVSRFNPHHI